MVEDDVCTRARLRAVRAASLAPEVMDCSAYPVCTVQMHQDDPFSIRFCSVLCRCHGAYAAVARAETQGACRHAGLKQGGMQRVVASHPMVTAFGHLPGLAADHDASQAPLPWRVQEEAPSFFAKYASRSRGRQRRSAVAGAEKTLPPQKPHWQPTREIDNSGVSTAQVY